MADAIKIEIFGTEEASGRLLAIKRLAGNLEEVFGDVGEHLLTSTRERFDLQVDPEGHRWLPLSEAWLDRKRREDKNPEKILVYEGDMRRYLRYQIEDDELAFGSDRVYAAAHQFAIGPRPWLGISHADEDAIEALLHKHFKKALG